jgi:hypothetical protein
LIAPGDQQEDQTGDGDKQARAQGKHVCDLIRLIQMTGLRVGGQQEQKNATEYHDPGQRSH